VTRNSDTQLILSAEHGNLEQVKRALDAGAKVDAVDKEGFTALHLAVLNNYMDIASYLLQRQASVDIENNRHDTPLHSAVINADIDFVRLLLQHGADPASSRTPIETAARLHPDNKVLLEMLDQALKVERKNPPELFTQRIHTPRRDRQHE
jgi:ankyrin repeat protein